MTTRTSRRSKEIAPSPTHSGRYRPVNGTTASVSRNGAKGSSTLVTTWAATSRTAASDSVPCSASTTKRGQRGDDQRETSAIPSARLPVSSTSATAPVPRERYHSAVELEPVATTAKVTRRWPPGPARANRRHGPRNRRADTAWRAAPSAPATRRRRRRERSPPWWPCSRPRTSRQQRRRSATGRLQAPGRRVEDMVDLASPRCHCRTVVLEVASAPVATRPSPRSVRGRGMVVGHPNQPAVSGRRPRAREVPAEVDEHAAPRGARCGLCAAIGRERLRRGAEVEHDACWHADRAGGGIAIDHAPARSADRPQRLRRGADGIEVAVVAGQHERAADRGIDVAVGEARGAQRCPHRLDEQRAHGDRPAARGVDAGELAVGAKAAACQIDRVELARDRCAGARQRRRAIGEHNRRRPQRPPRGARGHDPPEVTGGCGSGWAGACCGACRGACRP